MYRFGTGMFLVNPYIFASGGPALDPDAEAFITAAAITDATQQSAVNQLVLDLKDYGIWTKMKAVWPFVGGTSTSHKWNLKDPRDLDAAFRLVFNGGWTHSATGALPNGTNGYANTFFNPVSESLSLSSAHLSAYNTTANSTGTSRAFVGNSQSGLPVDDNFFMLGLFSGGTIEAGVIGSNYGEYSGIITPFAGMKLTTTNSSRSNVYYKNGVAQPLTYTQNGTFYSANIYIGASNNYGSPLFFQNVNLAFISIGTGLSSTEAANFYTAVQAFQTTLSRNV